MAEQKTTTRRVNRWPGKKPLQAFIRSLGLKVEPQEALRRALAEGYVGAGLHNVYSARNHMRVRRSRQRHRPVAATVGAPPTKHVQSTPRPARVALTEDDRSFVAIALRIGPTRATQLLERVETLMGTLGLG